MLILTWVLGIATAVVGVLHFTWPEPFLRIMPPALPAPMMIPRARSPFPSTALISPSPLTFGLTAFRRLMPSSSTLPLAVLA